jgi:excinuclease ABC subunit A
VIDVGPGAGEDGGHIVVAGPPARVATAAGSRTARYLTRFLGESANGSRPARQA